MWHWKGLLCLAFALVSIANPAFVSTTISVDGQFADWAVVLADPQNSVSDGAKGAGDLDDPGQTSSDLRSFALTWDATNLYLYFKRGTTSQSGITCMIYLDADHDGLMETGEPLLFYSFNSAGFQGFSLYAYTESNPGGDPLGGDGTAPPGTVGTLLSTSGAGALDSEGVRFEASVSWAVLAPCGVITRSPLLVHPALTLGTNLPTQVQDNGENLDTLLCSLSITPGGEASLRPGETATFGHSVTNLGNATQTAELAALSLQGWEVSFWDAAGATPLSDSNGDGSVDTGPLAAGTSVGITIRVQIPSSTPTQTNDEVTVTVRAASNSSVTGEALDRIYAGFVVTFKRDQEKTAVPGITVPYYRQVVTNLTDSAVTMEVSTGSGQGWPVEVRSDTDCDDAPDTGPTSQVFLAAGATTCLITYVTIPLGTSWGTTDLTTTTVSFGDPLITIPVGSTTHADDLFSIRPDNDGSQGAGETILYSHSISNNGAAADVFDITSVSSQGWPVALFGADGVTPLADSDGDSIPDSGNLLPYGGTFSFKVRITIPVGTTFNMVDAATIMASSSLNPLEARAAVDTTTVKVLVTFSDAAYATPQSVFTPCTTLYAKAFGLSNGTYRFMVYDPSGSLKTMSPVELSPDQSGQVSDSYRLQPGDPLGAWTVKLQKKSGGSFADLPDYIAGFQHMNSGTISVNTGRAFYTLAGEVVSVQASAQNLNPVAMGGALSYVLFVDGNGNHAPDAGETYLRSDGTPAAFAAADATRVTSPFLVPAGSVKKDTWQLFVPDFGTLGTWHVWVEWRNDCSGLVASGFSTFQVILDNTPPVSAITWPSDGATLNLSSSPFSIAGTAGDTETYVAGVEVSTDGGSTWADAANTGVNFSTWSYAWSPFFRGSYTLKSRATDAVGHVEAAHATVGVTVVDDTPPTVPVVGDDGAFTAGVLHAVWSSEDPNSGIGSYGYCIGTSPGLCDALPYGDVGLSNEISRGDIALLDGVTYYFNVISTNLDGYDSAVGSSDGITADLEGPVSLIADPVGSQVLTGASYTIQGTASDTLSGVAQVQVSTDGGSSWQDALGATSWHFDWTLPLSDGTRVLRVRSQDIVGNWREGAAPVSVIVDQPPAGPSNLTAIPDGNCVVTLAWSPSPSPDLSRYEVYHNGGSGPVNYAAPVATVPASTHTWVSSRGVYGYCGQDVSLASGLEEIVVTYAIINANQEPFTLTGVRISWSPDTPQKFVSQVDLDGVPVFNSSPLNPGMSGATLPFTSPVALDAGQVAQVQFHMRNADGGDPVVTGVTMRATYAGGASPEVTTPLQAPGQVPSPCRPDETESLAVGADYVFGVRAVDLRGQDDGNTTVQVGSSACARSLAATVVSPKPGEKVRGQEVTVFAEITMGSVWICQQVLFQYRPSGGGIWTDIVPPPPGSHPNPDMSWPFFTYWNVSALAPGNYDIRAVARTIVGADDTSPPFLTISIVVAEENLLEQRDGSSRHFGAEDVTVMSTGNRLIVGDDLHNNATKVSIPPVALTSDTRCTVTQVPDPGTVPPGPDPPAWGTGNQFRDIVLASGQASLANGKLATVEIPVDDSDHDGEVDGTTTPLWNLGMYSWNGTSWVPVLSSQVDLTTGVVQGQTNHFTLFSPLEAPPNLADTVAPKAVTTLKITRAGNDLSFTWDPVTQDILNGAETVHHYAIYRGTARDFAPDKVGRTNLVGVSSTPPFFALNGVGDQPTYFYLVTAVDTGYNEGE